MAEKTKEQILAEVVNNISTLELARAITRIDGLTMQDVLNVLTTIENGQ